MTALRRVFALVSVRFFAGQLGLALAVALLYAVWLRVPDANAAWVALSFVLGAGIVTLATGGEAALLRHVAGLPVTRRTCLLGGLALLLALVLWGLWQVLLTRPPGADETLAGLWNSRLPRTLRPMLSYPRLVALLRFGWALLDLAGAAVLAALGIAACLQPHRPLAAWGRILRSGTYWLYAVGGGLLAWWLTGLLLNWTPGHGLRAEALSLALRLLAVVLLDCLLLSLALAAGVASAQLPESSRADARAISGQ